MRNLKRKKLAALMGEHRPNQEIDAAIMRQAGCLEAAGYLERMRENASQLGDWRLGDRVRGRAEGTYYRTFNARTERFARAVMTC